MTKIDNFTEWIKTLGKTSQTTYTIAWNVLVEYYKTQKDETITPNILLRKLIDDRKKEIEDQGEIELEINEWIKWMQTEYQQKKSGITKKGTVLFEKGRTEKKGLSPASIKSYLGGVRAFFSYYGYPLSRKIKVPQSIKMNNGELCNTKIEYRPHQVRKLLEVITSPRDRAITLVMFQSGMDISTTLNLNYGDVKEELEAGEEPLLIHTTRKKTGITFRTFIGRDAIDALQIYLNMRREKQEKIGFGTPLFVGDGTHIKKNADIKFKEQTQAEVDARKKPEIDYITLGEKSRCLPKNFQNNMKKYVISAGLVSKEKMDNATFNPARPHALRAGFSSIARLKGLNDGLINYFQGHKDEYNNAYTIMTNQELREKYLEIEPDLTISTVSNLGDIEAKMKEELELHVHMIRGMKERIIELEEGAKVFNEVFKEMAEIPELKETLAKHFK